jgi:hypothetical protein
MRIATQPLAPALSRDGRLARECRACPNHACPAMGTTDGEDDETDRNSDNPERPRIEH